MTIKANKEANAKWEQATSILEKIRLLEEIMKNLNG